MSTVLITGGSRGLGRNAALHLAKRGTNTILTYRSHEDEAAEAKSEVQKAGAKAEVLQLDTAEHGRFAEFGEQVKEALGRLGEDHLKGLVNNAGMGIDTPIGETKPDDIDALYAVHFKGPYLLAQTLLPLMKEGSSILNVSSGLARFALPGYAAYGAMKAAIEQLTRYQAKELGEKGIRAVCVAPGATETDFGGGRVRDNEDMNKMIAAQTALGRTGQPDDLGAVMAALLSDDMFWVTGETIEASGGMMI